MTVYEGGNWQEVFPPPHLSEQRIFKDYFIDVAVIAAVQYLSARTTFHLISMTFHRQPSVAGPRAGRGEGGLAEKERGALDSTQLTPRTIPNTIDLCRPPTGTPALFCIYET